jgi:hypothetical protein
LGRGRDGPVTEMVKRAEIMAMPNVASNVAQNACRNQKPSSPRGNAIH